MFSRKGWKINNFLLFIYFISFHSIIFFASRFLSRWLGAPTWWIAEKELFILLLFPLTLRNKFHPRFLYFTFWYFRVLFSYFLIQFECRKHDDRRNSRTSASSLIFNVLQFLSNLLCAFISLLLLLFICYDSEHEPLFNFNLFLWQ
jgi:hypothetical protein